MSRVIQLLEDPPTARPESIKLRGRIAAGEPLPVETLETVEDAEEFSFTDWEDTEEKFVLQVTGESMIDEHIADGDFVIIRRQEQARDGQIVAVLDGGGAILKRLFRERDRIRLEPANKAMKPIYRDSVTILGVLDGVVRRYHETAKSL